MIEKIIKKLEDGIEEAILNEDEMDDDDWSNQTGILLTPNEANKILNILEEIKNRVNGNVIISLN